MSLESDRKEPSRTFLGKKLNISADEANQKPKGHGAVDRLSPGMQDLWAEMAKEKEQQEGSRGWWVCEALGVSQETSQHLGNLAHPPPLVP